MIIDCHAHAFPDLDDHAEALRVPDTWRQHLASASVAARAALTPIGQALPPLPSLGIEELAALRQKGPAVLHHGLELVTSAVATPMMVFLAGTVERLLASMDRHGIDRTVVIGGPPVAKNDWLLDTARARGEGRLIVVTTTPALSPSADEQAWHEAFVDLADRGARGFKIHPNMDGLPADHVAYRALFEVARARDLPVILHTGCFSVVSYAHRHAAEPEAYASYFTDFPEVRVCLAHMNRDKPEAAWALMKRFDQLFADTSWQPAEAIRRAVEHVGADRITLGSDWPLLHSELQGDALAVLARGVSDEAFETITETSARRFLGEGVAAADVVTG